MAATTVDDYPNDVCTQIRDRLDDLWGPPLYLQNGQIRPGHILHKNSERFCVEENNETLNNNKACFANICGVSFVEEERLLTIYEKRFHKLWTEFIHEQQEWDFCQALIGYVQSNRLWAFCIWREDPSEKILECLKSLSINTLSSTSLAMHFQTLRTGGDMIPDVFPQMASLAIHVLRWAVRGLNQDDIEQIMQDLVNLELPPPRFAITGIQWWTDVFLVYFMDEWWITVEQILDIPEATRKSILAKIAMDRWEASWLTALESTLHSDDDRNKRHEALASLMDIVVWACPLSDSLLQSIQTCLTNIAAKHVQVCIAEVRRQIPTKNDDVKMRLRDLCQVVVTIYMEWRPLTICYERLMGNHCQNESSNNDQLPHYIHKAWFCGGGHETATMFLNADHRFYLFQACSIVLQKYLKHILRPPSVPLLPSICETLRNLLMTAGCLRKPMDMLLFWMDMLWDYVPPPCYHSKTLTIQEIARRVGYRFRTSAMLRPATELRQFLGNECRFVFLSKQHSACRLFWSQVQRDIQSMPQHRRLALDGSVMCAYVTPLSIFHCLNNQMDLYLELRNLDGASWLRYLPENIQKSTREWTVCTAFNQKVWHLFSSVHIEFVVEFSTARDSNAQRMFRNHLEQLTSGVFDFVSTDPPPPPPKRNEIRAALAECFKQKKRHPAVVLHTFAGIKTHLTMTLLQYVMLLLVQQSMTMTARRLSCLLFKNSERFTPLISSALRPLTQPYLGMCEGFDNDDIDSPIRMRSSMAGEHFLSDLDKHLRRILEAGRPYRLVVQDVVQKIQDIDIPPPPSLPSTGFCLHLEVPEDLRAWDKWVFPLLDKNDDDDDKTPQARVDSVSAFLEEALQAHLMQHMKAARCVLTTEVHKIASLFLAKHKTTTPPTMIQKVIDCLVRQNLLEYKDEEMEDNKYIMYVI